MSVTYGFYNSQNGDRKYDAVQISSIFDGIIMDGVLQHVGDMLIVNASEGLTINVGTGRAWFNHTWTLNDSILPLTVSEPEVILDRIDAVVLEVNARESERANTIKIIAGVPSSNPVEPPMIETNNCWQHPLAFIRVNSGVTSIRQADITNCVGTSRCPFVTAPLEKMDIDALIAQWRSQWSSFYETEIDDMIATRELWKSTWETMFSDTFFDALDEFVSPEVHRTLFRGKNLGSELTYEQRLQIQNGTFRDLWLGDYWEIGGYRYRIADFDYWEYCGMVSIPELLIKRHHLVIVPDQVIGPPSMIAANFQYGYAGSTIRRNHLNSVKDTIISAFGSSNIGTITEYLINSIDEYGTVEGTLEVETTVELLSEIMVYGRSTLGASYVHNYNSIDPDCSTNDRNQLSLFSIAPRYIVTEKYRKNSGGPYETYDIHPYWLRDPSSIAGCFMGVTSEGKLGVYASINSQLYIRPVFALIGGDI